MAIHDHSNVSSSALLEGDCGISLDAGEQIPAGECHVPKMRKPYTITKQRERWTGEEHDKFLEAMKLYGRAWRKIEEHVGTKTAVQIRSHAQKFFSKVARESSHGNSGSIEPIDIPPPRPKRKPAHPYPRKLARPAKKDALQEQLARSVSPISSVNQANRSPTSVLSTLDGNTRSSADWEPMDSSSSPVSSPDNLNSAECLPSEADPKLPKPISPKLELHPGVGALGKDGSGETTSAKRLRLFGKTLSVNHDVAEVEEISDAGAANPENSACQLSPTLVPYLCYVNENGVPIPCCPVYGGIQIPFVTPSNADSHGRAEGNLKDGSSSGSNPVSMNASGSCDGNSDSETRSYEMVKNGRNLISQPSSFANLKSSSSVSSEKPQRGFVPYRRSLSEMEGRSFLATGTKEESEMVRLSL